jgi:uncharacterized iron-regulated membrane protein
MEIRKGNDAEYPHVLLAASMAAGVTIVFVGAMKTLARSFHRPTAIVLALGVTILAVVGTAHVIFVGPQGGEPGLSVPRGNTLILLPFIALAIASLLAQLLAATSGAVPQAKPQQVPGEIADVEPQVPPDAKLAKNTPARSRPRGRPRKQSPRSPPAALRKMREEDEFIEAAASPAADAAAKQKSAGAAESTEQS